MNFKPRKLMLMCVLAVMAVAVLASCGGGPPQKPRSRAFGRTLHIVVSPPVFIDRIGIERKGEHFVIRPTQPSKRLAAVKITLVNRNITTAPLLIDTSAAQIGSSKGGRRIFALNPFDSSQRIDVADPEEDRFTPLLWGDVKLTKGYQASGWMIFEIPAGLQVDTLWWHEADDIIVRL